MKERIRPEICTEPLREERAGPLEDERRVSLGHLEGWARSLGSLPRPLWKACTILRGGKLRRRPCRQQWPRKGAEAV